jgi:hypothetical protein
MHPLYCPSLQVEEQYKRDVARVRGADAVASEDDYKTFLKARVWQLAVFAVFLPGFLWFLATGLTACLGSAHACLCVPVRRSWAAPPHLS